MWVVVVVVVVGRFLFRVRGLGRELLLFVVLVVVPGGRLGSRLIIIIIITITPATPNRLMSESELNKL